MSIGDYSIPIAELNPSQLKEIGLKATDKEAFSLLHGKLISKLNGGQSVPLISGKGFKNLYVNADIVSEIFRKIVANSGEGGNKQELKLALLQYKKIAKVLVGASFASRSKSLGKVIGLAHKQLVKDRQYAGVNPLYLGDASSAAATIAAAVTKASAIVPFLHLYRFKFDTAEQKEILGQGAFGSVARVNYQVGDNTIEAAVKTPLSYFSGCVEAHNEEAILHVRISQAAAKSRHPGAQFIVKAHGIIESKGTYQLVTEYCNGGSLEQPNASLSLSDRLRILEEARLGLEYAASLGVVHRDISARNIFLATGKDGRLHARVGDFGRAKEGFGKAKVNDSAPVKWQAPEELKEREYSQRSDVWAFGCFCYEVITGQPPYEGIAQDTLALAIIDGSIRHPFDFNGIERALSKMKQSPEVKNGRLANQTAKEAWTAIPEAARQIILSCFNPDSETRPYFDEFKIPQLT